ncbi:MAG: GNAT family N-acetyltransferase, partial [Acidimicrobiia bacterium]
HRNKGLGRLLKASMAKRFVGEFPDVEWIDTGNAGSNEPMLNINIAMGFKPVLMINAWQGEIAKARRALQT